MEPDEIEAFLMAMDMLKARDEIVQMRIALVPNLKEEGYRKLHREAHKRAFPDYKPNVIKFDDIDQIIK